MSWRYDPGAGIGWHRDRALFQTMRFRRRRPNGFDRRSALLVPHSVYHLSNDARHEWEHSIAEMAVTRWSITFRGLSAVGQRYTRGNNGRAAPD